MDLKPIFCLQKFSFSFFVFFHFQTIVKQRKEDSIFPEIRVLRNNDLNSLRFGKKKKVFENYGYSSLQSL